MFELTTIEALALSLGAMAGGIILLIRGGGWTVDSAVFIAKKHGISPLLIGFTIVAGGTSLPEMIVSVLANMNGLPGIALGNVIGSNIANILFIIAATAVIVPLRTVSKGVIKDLVMMMAAAIILIALMLHGVIGRAAGLAMMAALCGYIYLQYKMVKAGEVPPDDLENPAFPSQAAAYGFLLIGLVAVAAGAEFLVRGAKVGAEVIGVPDAVIALSVIALGTSLPELTTCLIAARKKHHEIVFGNIIGSNVFNILMILGATALIRPVAVRDAAQQLVSFDMWVMLAVSLIFAGLVVFGNGIGRRTGALFIGAYFVYNIYIYAIYIT